MEPQNLELFAAVLIGIGLSAACGFRVFVPLLGASIAAHAGLLHLAPEFSWLAGLPALLALALATLLEIGAYSIPFIDNLVDTVTTPVAVIAGTMLMASLLGDMSPFFQWSLAVIAGGGTAGMVQGGTLLARGGISAVSGGLGNLAMALLEFAGAVLITLLALFAPFVAALGLLFGFYFLLRHLSRRHQA